ncbi:hypothetical protein MPSEU_000868500 [Mayamaea pseudoterrestris]|nr:hypothetical protein MPSEU_000868500 [Mayamaea pseudoterrestris]
MNVHSTHSFEKRSSFAAAAAPDDGDDDEDQESHSTDQTQKASNLTVSKREVEASRQIVRAYLDVAIDTLNRGRFEALNGIVSLRAVQNPMARARTFEEATDLLRNHQDELLPENHFLRARFNEFLQHALVLAPPPNASLEARYNDFWIQERRRVGERRSSDASK